MIEANIQPNFKSWRIAARKLLSADVQPADVLWTQGSNAGLPLLATPLALMPLDESTSNRFMVPEGFVSLAKTISMHRDSERWAVLYRTLYRITHGQPHLMEIAVDDDVHRLREMEKSVRRDLHKMHAFVRFRKLDNQEMYVAFHRPDHLIMPAAAPWFARRFAIMQWTIFTPDASAAWDGASIEYGPGVPASAVPNDDGMEELWRTYYANIFNPARIKIAAMKKEMPVRHWATLPETQLIDDLLRDAPARVEEMMRRTKPNDSTSIPTAKSAADYVPRTLELSVLREAARTCQGCDLYCNATQTVFGEGAAHAKVMLVGEQPGDQEDLAGKPFVGPAGQLLNEALLTAGIDRSQCYVTNTVKHFKFEQRGTRRIHSKPSARDISACKPWLAAEIAVIKPQMIIALGATAAQALMGPQFRITKQHGQVFTDTNWSPRLMATIHPSALLRIPDPVLREQSHREFVEDLTAAATEIARLG